MKPEIKKQLQNRLRRIEGQIRGLEKMVEKESYCIDVITQAQAARRALEAFEALMLKNHLETHVIDQMRHGKESTAIDEMLAVYRTTQRK